MVDLRAVEPLPHPVTLAAIKKRRELAAMQLVRLSRLSVSPVSRAEWDVVQSMARAGE
jgi:predicted RNA-binding protein with PUA-like domain